ncbi:hypothetical protein D3C86_2065900 [compost metagenome]
MCDDSWLCAIQEVLIAFREVIWCHTGSELLVSIGAYCVAIGNRQCVDAFAGFIVQCSRTDSNHETFGNDNFLLIGRSIVVNE